MKKGQKKKTRTNIIQKKKKPKKTNKQNRFQNKNGNFKK